MTEIRFYHLMNKSLEQALPELVAKGLSAGHRIVIRAGDAGMVERLNEILWTAKPDSFIPHGSGKDGHADQQPVWLTVDDENPNKATMLVLTGGTDCVDFSAYTLCCDIFDGRNEEAVISARTRWKNCSEAGHTLAYWQQSESGTWEKKAESGKRSKDTQAEEGEQAA